MKILLVEDEKKIADGVVTILKQDRYETDVAYDGISGLDSMLSDVYDLILLDIMLPQMDGIDVLEQAREEGIHTPIILLTAKAQKEDVIRGLNSGADDYLTKPFDGGELLARVRAQMRGRQMKRLAELTIGEVRLDQNTYELLCRDKSVKLSRKEYQLMEYFLMNQGRILSRDMLLSRVWGPDSDADYNNLEVYISFLRKKLKYLDTDVKLLTTKGVGYSIEVLHYDA